MKIIGITLAAAALSIGLASPASADSELGFLSELNGFGIVINNAPIALTRGYQICNTLKTIPAEQVAVLFYTKMDDEVPTVEVARWWVLSASDQLCPWAQVTRS